MYAIKGLLHEALAFNYPTDKVLSNFFRNNRNLNNTERNIAAETLYSLLRNYYKITSSTDKKNLFALIGVIWTKFLALDKKTLQSVTCIDFTKYATIEFADTLTNTMELPQWITDRLIKAYGENDATLLAQAMQHQAPLDLRVNIIKTDSNKVTQILDQEKIAYQLTQFSPYGIRLNAKTFLAKHKIFNDGLIEVQDESSQIAGMLLNPKRGEMLVDFCAGSGGKTLLFGMLMRNTGRIYAFDINEKRLNNLAPRLARSGLSNIHTQLIAHENDTKIKRLHNKIDRVFVDAPCTGLGTLRRNPDLKLRQTEGGLNEINQKQLSILNSASKLVKSGGHLVYATCSILNCENQGIVNKFLAANKDFILVPASVTLNKPELEREDGYLVLLPHIHQTDGFFAALLKRK